MSSCCNGNCGCGSGCKCGSSCTGGETMVFGLAPEKAYFEGSEMGVGAENDGCKCGPNCTCNPCTCK
ncbi:hypothetical protein AQUCO_02700353v1 [Aquilegia coerulea]|uniref:Metallothionein-like protein n=1 Tax=Aquilegia coerulea TaxID=218851 RepID=A0A2G5D6H9_AQUCA|nr:hypothetical protein AQUCO_02700353v1 [Aquilegia coerulea]